MVKCLYRGVFFVGVRAYMLYTRALCACLVDVLFLGAVGVAYQFMTLARMVLCEPCIFIFP